MSGTGSMVKTVLVTATVTIAALGAAGGGYAYASGGLNDLLDRAPASADPSNPATPTTPSKTTPSKAAPSKTAPEKTTPAKRAAPLMALESRGDDVRELEARLVESGALEKQWVDGYFGTLTRNAVRSFQAGNGLAVTGSVDRGTLDELGAQTGEPTREQLYPPKPKPVAGVDSRCLTGRVICVDKSTRRLRWVIDGQVKVSMDARFGSRRTPTREGEFQIHGKVRHGYSRMYGSKMPFAMFFSRSQAVHYSADFDRRGYNGASHGCVNVRNWNAVAQVFSEARVGDKVVVYWA